MITNAAMMPLYENQFFEELRVSEFKRLDKNNQVYFDFTGGNLYPQSLLITHFERLKSGVYGNPHSTNPTSLASTLLLNESRNKVIDFFNAQDYFCVFTANASNSLKIVGESYPFDHESTFILSSDNHNSVNGIREFCNAKKGKTIYIPVDIDDLNLDEQFLEKTISNINFPNKSLFAYPAQSNVTGIKHNLSWIEKVQNKGIDVLLDAAAYVPTSKLDLSKVKPNFVSLSFYKMFGYPTGLGCLFIRKDTFSKLRKPWFAGGTVEFVSVKNQLNALIPNHERYEDGTINYLDIPLIKDGLEFIEKIGYNKINLRVKSLIEYLVSKMQDLKYENGSPLVKIFGPLTFEKRGGNIIFNIFDDNEKVIPFYQVETIINSHNISVRTGCFCNPGIDETNHCITIEEIMDSYSSRGCQDYNFFKTKLGKMRGAIRVSVGISTVKNDIDKFSEVLKSLINHQTLN